MNALLTVFVGGSLVLCLIFSVKWGGRGEKLTACGLVLAAIGSTLSNTSRYTHLETGILVIDALLFLALVGIALRSDRFWPLWAAAFQMIAVFVHIATIAKTDDYAWAYAIAVNFWSYPVMYALIGGIALESRKRPMAGHPVS